MVDSTWKQAIEARKIMSEILSLTKSMLAYVAVVNDNQYDVTMLAWSVGAMVGCTMENKPINYSIDKMGVWGDAMRLRKIDIINDYSACKRSSKHGYPSGHVEIKRHMNGPVIIVNKVIAIIGVGNKSDDYRPEDEKAFRDYLAVNAERINAMKVAEFG